MSDLIERDKAMLDEFHFDFWNNAELQEAIRDYTENRGLFLPEDARFSPGIDCVGVFIKGRLVLSVGLPPVSNYEIRETEYTDKYLRKRKPIAV